MKLDQKAIISAAAILIGEEKKARDKIVAELRAAIAAQEQRLAALERGPSRLRAVGGE